MPPTPPLWPVAPPAPTRSRFAAVLKALVLTSSIGAVAFGVFALARTAPSPPTPTPTFTATQHSDAQTKLCERYDLAARALGYESNASETPEGPEDQKALIRAAATNGSLMLEVAAQDPALDDKFRDPAYALSVAYQKMAALGTNGMASKEEYAAAVDDVNAKEVVMEQLCGGS